MTQSATGHPLRGDLGGGGGGQSAVREGDAPRGEDLRGGRRSGGAGAGFGARLAGAAGAALASAGPVLFYLVLAACVLWPYRSSKFRTAGDLNVVIGCTVEARNALAEGQFPVRVAPREHDGARYPIFQYYANFPYTVTGAMTLAGLSPHTAWRLLMLAALTCGGLFVYRVGRYLTRDALAAAAGGAAFAVAPYMLVDLNARGAFAELIAFNLLPVALYACLRCLASRRRRWRYVPAAAVAWALVGLSHNIAYLYGVLLVGLLVLSMVGGGRRGRSRLGRLAAAGALHAALMLWYVVPQLQTLPHLEMHGQTGNPRNPALTGLSILLAPVLTIPPGSTTANLGLQVGWPVLAGALLVVAGLLVRRRRTPGRLRRVGWRVLALFALAFFLVWSPVNVWQYLPKPFWFVQFTYRLFMFTTLFGALLVATALAIWTRGRPLPHRRVGMVLALAVVAAAASAYMPRGAGKLDRTYVRDQLERPTLGGRFDYLLAPAALGGRDAFVRTDVDLAHPEFGLTRGLPYLREDGAPLRMAVPDYTKGLNVKGHAVDGPAELRVRLGTREFGVRVRQGAFDFSIPLPRCFCGDSPLLGFRAIDERGRPTRVVLGALGFEGVTYPPDDALVTADAVRHQVRYGRVTKLRYETDRPVTLQLPVLYYPGVLRVTNYGEPVAFGNVGRYVAVQLPPGKHRLGVQYVGARWATATSGLAWAGVAAVPLAALRRRRRQRHDPAPAELDPHAGLAPARRRRPAAFTLVDGMTGCAAVFVVVGAALGTPWLVDRLADPDAVHVSCDTPPTAPEFGAANAFDGNPDTIWASPGPTTESATMTVTRDRARPLKRLTLEARQTVLMETWQRVRVAATLDGWQVFDHTYDMPEAATRRVVTVGLDLPSVDRVELTFSEPVLTPLDGGPRVSRDVVNPGYGEIRLEWVEE